ncbi:MAG: TRAP transporter large permease [Betaproteobacteria bacterium]
MSATLILFGIFMVTMLIGIPVAFALCLGALSVLWMTGFLAPELVVQRIFAGMDSFPIMAIPFFVLAGALMETGGISARLVRFSNCLVGWIAGGLAHVAVVASMFFAGISGSAVADTAAISSTMIPIMKRRGFDSGFSAALIAAAGVIGPIIPPSIPMVLYGSIAGVSIGSLFLGGIIPGVFMGVSLMALIYIFARRGKTFPPPEPRPTARALLDAFVAASGALVMPFIIVGGILSGVFTATEAAVVAAVYALVVGMFVYRELKWRDVPDILFKASVSTAMVLIIVGIANLVGFILAMNQIPDAIAAYFTATFNSQLSVLLVINILLLIVGCFIDGGSAIIIFTPVLMPLVAKFGIDPIFFGVMMTINLMIGTITPPVGLSLYVAGGVAGLSLEKVSRAVVPFLLLEVAVLAVITLVPEVVLVVPRIFAK